MRRRETEVSSRVLRSPPCQPSLSTTAYLSLSLSLSLSSLLTPHTSHLTPLATVIGRTAVIWRHETVASTNRDLFLRTTESSPRFDQIFKILLYSAPRLFAFLLLFFPSFSSSFSINPTFNS
jgi:hypothetical protein